MSIDPMSPRKDRAGNDRQAAESETERQMRSDFMHAESLASRNPEDYDPADSLDYAEYANRWIEDEKWMNEWLYLSDATTRWQDDPALAGDWFRRVVNAGALSPIQARSEEQARYIAEHGIERSESGLLTSHYVTRVEQRAEFGPTDIEYYADRAPDGEQGLRAAFASYDQARQGGDHRTADAIDLHWREREDEAGMQWQHLNQVTAEWRRDPDTMRWLHGQVETHQLTGPPPTPNEWRNLQQARELTGNGAWTVEKQSEQDHTHPFASLDADHSRKGLTR